MLHDIQLKDLQLWYVDDLSSSCSPAQKFQGATGTSDPLKDILFSNTFTSSESNRCLLLSAIFSTSEFTVFNFEGTISFHFKKSYLALPETMAHVTCSLIKCWRLENWVFGSKACLLVREISVLRNVMNYLTQYLS